MAVARGVGGSLGYPVTDALKTVGIISGRFENGVIYAAHITWPVISTFQLRDSLGSHYFGLRGGWGAEGWLGLPKGAGTAVKPGASSGDDYVNFMNGIIVDHNTGDPSNPQQIYKFGELQFWLTRFAGHTGWDWGTSCDTWGKLTVDTSAGNVTHQQREPANGDQTMSKSIPVGP